MKMNSLVDPEMIDQLYAASQAGVEIDLIVRGICCLRPGVPGPVRDTSGCGRSSGRYLEHSRIYRFANGGGAGVRRSLHRLGRPDAPQPRPPGRGAGAGRPIPRCEARLREVLDVNLADDSLAWTLGPDGRWEVVKGTGAVHAQVRFHELALARARRATTDDD